MRRVDKRPLTSNNARRDEPAAPVVARFGLYNEGRVECNCCVVAGRYNNSGGYRLTKNLILNIFYTSQSPREVAFYYENTVTGVALPA